MKTDTQIKQDVLDELVFQPNIDETQIGVIVKNGIVTLTGRVFSYAHKIAAEEAVKKVKGVKAVAEDIEVGYDTKEDRTDTEIANAIIDALLWNTAVPEEKISVKVEDGYIFLTGEVDWSYQKEDTKRVIQNLAGVKGIFSDITIKKTDEKPFQIKERISKAFERSVHINANNITIEFMEDHIIKLTGKVHSLVEKEEAQKSAFYARGIYEVKNELEVIT
ncbi:BON domain-containing protein [Formosa sp. PL04]|uniref:BON domain-containing protein n=1 Tax=Formosa sp. PL04 TaxID=3081755 RepID=UPI00298238BF|nr:BON domain-containing protein [Formosa sp. PL04]MDW5290687.1 BON domain-containing protein [Formosa sp. PL04]